WWPAPASIRSRCGPGRSASAPCAAPSSTCADDRRLLPIVRVLADPSRSRTMGPAAGGRASRGGLVEPVLHRTADGDLAHGDDGPHLLVERHQPPAVVEEGRPVDRLLLAESLDEAIVGGEALLRLSIEEHGGDVEDLLGHPGEGLSVLERDGPLEP